jgi:hypothetical protein
VTASLAVSGLKLPLLGSLAISLAPDLDASPVQAPIFRLADPVAAIFVGLADASVETVGDKLFLRMPRPPDRLHPSTLGACDALLTHSVTSEDGGAGEIVFKFNGVKLPRRG